jgi:hypothetical protein
MVGVNSSDKGDSDSAEVISRWRFLVGASRLFSFSEVRSDEPALSAEVASFDSPLFKPSIAARRSQ